MSDGITKRTIVADRINCILLHDVNWNLRLDSSLVQNDVGVQAGRTKRRLPQGEIKKNVIEGRYPPATLINVSAASVEASLTSNCILNGQLLAREHPLPHSLCCQRHALVS